MRMMFVGDINLGEYYTCFGHGPATYLQHSDVFKNVRSIFDKADFVAGNLEAPLTTNNFDPAEPERVVLRGSPMHAKLLSESGFKILQVANNHTVQHGKEGFEETVQALKNSGIDAIGLHQQKLVKIHLHGESIGFLAASDVPDNTDKSQSSYQRLDAAFIDKAKAAVSEVDHVIVMLHWGLEASTKPLEYQLTLIQELKQAGVRGVIGSHPHLFYEAWTDGNYIAAPSLGNFVFDLCWDQRLLQTGILDIEINNNELKAQIWPIEITEDGCLPTPNGEPVILTPRATLYDLGDDMAGEQIRKLRYFFKNIHKGHTRLKAKFIARKFLSPLKSLLPGTSHG